MAERDISRQSALKENIRKESPFNDPVVREGILAGARTLMNGLLIASDCIPGGLGEVGDFAMGAIKTVNGICRQLTGKDIRLLPDTMPDAGLLLIITSETGEIVSFPLHGGVAPSILIPVLKQLSADWPRMREAIKRVRRKDVQEAATVFEQERPGLPGDNKFWK